MRKELLAVVAGLGMTLAYHAVSAQANNRPPRISGTPVRTVAAGDEYFFKPSASDPEGRTLTFSILRKPGWASFNTKTGRLAGSPGTSNVGVYERIVISVTDGTTKVTLPAFDLSVNQGANGSVTLSWLPPTAYSDGTTMNDLAGYRIYYGQSSGNLNRTIVLDSPGTTRHVIEGLSSTRWYFAMTSVNRNGDESVRSSTLSKNIG